MTFNKNYKKQRFYYIHRAVIRRRHMFIDQNQRALENMNQKISNNKIGSFKHYFFFSV